MNITPFDSSMHLNDYMQTLSRNKGAIVLTILCVFGATLAANIFAKPVYRASATLVIGNEQSRSPLTGEPLNYESYASETLTFNTHFKLIASRPVLEKVVDALRLDKDRNNPEKGFFGKIAERIKDNLHLLLYRRQRIADPMEKRTELIKIVRDKIVVEEIPDTRLLVLNVEDEDPVMAQEMANSLCANYIEFDRANRLKSSDNTIDWMTDQLYGMKKKLEDAEAEFLAFKENEKLFSISGKQRVIDQKIEDFNEQYLKARNERLAIDARLSKLSENMQGGRGDTSARSLLDNPLIENLYAQMLDAEVELAKLGKVFKGKHPKIVQAQGALEQIRQKLQSELEKEIKGLEARRSVLAQRENVLEKTVSDFENDALETNKKELRYRILERNVDTHQNLYDTLLSKLKESDITGNLDVSSIRVAEEAARPINPVKPKVILQLVFELDIRGGIRGRSCFFSGVPGPDDTKRGGCSKILGLARFVRGARREDVGADHSRNFFESGKRGRLNPVGHWR